MPRPPASPSETRPTVKVGYSASDSFPLYLDRAVAGTNPADLAQFGKVIELASASDVVGLTVGSTVSAEASYSGNALLRLLDFISVMLPLVLNEQQGSSRSLSTARSRTTGAQGRPAHTRTPVEEDPDAMQRMMAGLVRAAKDDMSANPVLDLLLESGCGVPIVATFDRASLGTAGDGLLQDTSFTLVGKVTRVLAPGEEINLFRRCLLAATGPQMSREMLAELTEGELDLKLADPVVEGPAIQVLPLAVMI